MLTVLTCSPKPDNLRAYDDSDSSFLEMMRYRLRIAHKEIHDRLQYQLQQRERLATFADETDGLSAATVVAMRKNIEVRRWAGRARANQRRRDAWH
eukprot:7391607-Prymnesium_polylepis.1